MNTAECSEKLLTYFSPEERSIPDSPDYQGCNAAVLAAMNSAMQDLYGKGRPWVRNDSRGALLNDPAIVPITCVHGSAAVTIPPEDWQPWFVGCAITIVGAVGDNRIRAAGILKFPYTGSTGTHLATIYHDSVELDSDVLEVRGRVRLDGRQLALSLVPDSPDEFHENQDFGFQSQYHRPTGYLSASETAGVPVLFSVETFPAGDEQPSGVRIILHPPPLRGGLLDYAVMLCPPRLTDVTSLAELPVPFGFIESVFLPIAVKKLRSCPFWRGIVADEEVQADFVNALTLLRDADPARTRGVKFITQF